MAVNGPFYLQFLSYKGVCVCGGGGGVLMILSNGSCCHQGSDQLQVIP